MAGRALARAVPPPPRLHRHLLDREPRASARAWSRQFNDPPQCPSVHALGFATPQDMQATGRYFYGALPIPDETYEALKHCHRHLRRQLRVGVLGLKSPNASGATEYLWAGPRPLTVLGFRLLTGLLAVDRVNGVNYLDFRSVELVLEPPSALAQELLAAWSGVDLRPLRCWPQQLADLLFDPHLAISGARPAAPLRQEVVHHGALRWLYGRVIVEAWHDVALECFARAYPTRTIAWTLGEAPCKRAARTRPVAVPMRLPVTSLWAASEQRQHPLLVHARADRERPRGWAAAIMRLGRNDSTVIAFLGRAAPAPFASYASTWEAHWTWPEELPQASSDRASA